MLSVYVLDEPLTATQLSNSIGGGGGTLIASNPVIIITFGEEAIKSFQRIKAYKMPCVKSLTVI